MPYVSLLFLGIHLNGAARGECGGGGWGVEVVGSLQSERLLAHLLSERY